MNYTLLGEYIKHAHCFAGILSITLLNELKEKSNRCVTSSSAYRSIIEAQAKYFNVVYVWMPAQMDDLNGRFYLQVSK